MKETRKNIMTAAMLSLAVIGPASFLMGIAYLVSRDETISSTMFFGAFIADLIGVYWWASRHIGPHKRLTVHGFIAHVKMHPELLQGASEFDLERFRKLQRGRSQAGLDAWIRRFRQFRGEMKGTRASSQFR